MSPQGIVLSSSGNGYLTEKKTPSPSRNTNKSENQILTSKNNESTPENIISEFKKELKSYNH